MDRVDRGDAGRVWAEAARHAAEARAQELARALPPALEEGNPRGPEETGRLPAEGGRRGPPPPPPPPPPRPSGERRPFAARAGHGPRPILCRSCSARRLRPPGGHV